MDEQKLKTIKVLTISAVLFIFILISAVVINLVTLAQKNAEKRRLEAELQRLEIVLQTNQESITYMETDEFIEKYARDILNMIRKDEQGFVGKEKK